MYLEVYFLIHLLFNYVFRGVHGGAVAKTLLSEQGAYRFDPWLGN